MIIVKYETEAEAEANKAEKEAQGFKLTEVRNITEGNFLGFQEPGWKEPEYPKQLNEQYNQLKLQLAEANAATLELYELITQGECSNGRSESYVYTSCLCYGDH